MSNRTPSLLALLGIAAAAGYQNRDRLKDVIDGFAAKHQASQPAITGTPVGASSVQNTPQTRFVDTLQQGLAELIQRLRKTGNEATAKSWLNTGQNIAITPDQLRASLGPDVIADLTRKTGLSDLDLLARLAQVLPHTVDQLTPDGTLQLADRWQQSGN